MNLFITILQRLSRPFIRANVVVDNSVTEFISESSGEVAYVLADDAISDKLALSQASKKLDLISPFVSVTTKTGSLKRTLSVKPYKYSWVKATEQQKNIVEAGKSLLDYAKESDNEIMLVPVTVCWGRWAGSEKKQKQSSFSFLDLLSESFETNPIRRFIVVLFAGRHAVVRINKPIPLVNMIATYGHNEKTAHKLIRLARIHFERQRLVVTGPKTLNRQALRNGILATDSIKKAIADEVKSKGISTAKAKQNAIKLIDEIAADYNENYIHFGSRVLSWIWNKIYNGIRVHNAAELRNLAQKGHEIVYVPCHRSHMDYLLLTYVIYKEGLVPPHIAAGINLNFWPAGSLFRKAGAFFIRRSFRGNKLYSAIFREYLGQLYAKGHPVKYYTEGGRSRTGRLLSPKTGMITMTVQAMLRGIERPITLVPVYIGYEQVMEVGTYLKELKGKNKESESILGIFRAFKKLKNYGHGDVNFGTPIYLNQLLSESAPEWKSQIDPNEVAKPQWLTPVVNKIANNVMCNINDAAVLNTVNLSALTLLVSDNHALLRADMSSLIEFLIKVQKVNPYSEHVQMPDTSGEQIISEALSLGKIEAEDDAQGSIIKLSDKNAILMSYYFNNVIHLFVIPGIIASELVHAKATSEAKIIHKVNTLLPLFRDELFLNELNIEEMVHTFIQFLAEEKGFISLGTKIEILDRNHVEYFQLIMLSKLTKDSLQRYALGFSRVAQAKGISRKELEQSCQRSAEKLVKLHSIKAPEYFDKKVISSFVTSMRENNYIDIDENGLMHLSESGNEAANVVNSLFATDVLQSINSIT